MRAKFVNENLSEDTDVLDQLLQKRFNFLKKFSEKEKKDGYRGLSNLRIENNSIIHGNDINDCKYDNEYFYIVGNEGEEKVRIKKDFIKEDFLKEIKKLAKEVNCGGLK